MMHWWRRRKVARVVREQREQDLRIAVALLTDLSRQMSVSLRELKQRASALDEIARKLTRIAAQIKQ